MTDRSTKLQRPDLNLEAILGLVGILLGFLFIVVIYILEYPQDVLTVWGLPLIFYLAFCYGLGLSIIGFIISYEIYFYLANKALELEPADYAQEKFEELQKNMNRSFRRSVQMFLYFIFSFGLFLISLAGFAVAKIFFPFFYPLEYAIMLYWGEGALMIIRSLVMFIYQLILIFPFASYQGNLWDSFKAVFDYEKHEKS